MEEWKYIDGYADYMVSNTGKVLSFKKDKVNGRLLKPMRVQCKFYKEEEYGFYVRVSLNNNNGSKTKNIHRLVAESFLPNPQKLPCVNHKNGIKNDNRVENLEWCDHTYNIWHSVNIINSELFGDSKENKYLNERTIKRERGIRKKYNRKRNYDQVVEREDFDLNEYKEKKAVVMISKYGEAIRAFHSVADAARFLDKDNGSIYCCCNRKKNYNMAHGYIWRYVNDFDRNEFEQFIGKKIVQHTEWGVKIKEYDDLIVAAKENDVCILNLIDCVNGNVETAFKTKWCFSTDYKEVTTNKWLPIVQLDIDWNYIMEYPCMTSAAKDNTTSCISRIYECCKSCGRHTSGGYRWMYKTDYDRKYNLVENKNQ